MKRAILELYLCKVASTDMCNSDGRKQGNQMAWHQEQKQGRKIIETPAAEMAAWHLHKVYVTVSRVSVDFMVEMCSVQRMYGSCIKNKWTYTWNITHWFVEHRFKALSLALWSFPSRGDHTVFGWEAGTRQGYAMLRGCKLSINSLLKPETQLHCLLYSKWDHNL